MTRLTYALTLLQSLVLCSPSVKDISADVTYQGVLSDSGKVEHFYRVPYAEDTSGENRFAPPKPIHPLKGSTIDATHRGPACPQLQIDLIPAFNKPDQISEDCLSVFIARPANLDISHDSKLPVLAWLHGGGAVYGSNNDPHTDPDKLIELSTELNQPVIFVGINYRLGIFGYAAADILQTQKSQNNALRDQRLAFEWIQQNIGIFGGDPERITAYGLSAGGTQISLQHIAYGGEKGVPFNQAYIMSGPPGTALRQTSENSKVNTANVAARLNCPTSEQAMLDCLRRISVNDLINASYSYAIENRPPLGLFTFTPVVDGDIIPERASELVRQGRFAKGVPLIAAWTEDDGATNVGTGSAIKNEVELGKALEPWIGGSLSEAQLAKMLELYSFSDFEARARTHNQLNPQSEQDISPHWYRGSAFVRDLLFTCSSINFAHQVFQQTRSQKANHSFNDVWLYQLNQSMLSPLFDSMGMSYVGASHGSDTHYIFNGVFPEGNVSSPDQSLSRTFAASVIHFAHTGTPSDIAGNTFKSWPMAFNEQTTDIDDQGLMPSDFALLVIGGPYGTTPVKLSKAHEAGLHEQLTEEFANAQQVMGESIGRMLSANSQKAQASVQQQKLFQRCEFVNSLTEEFGI